MLKKYRVEIIIGWLIVLILFGIAISNIVLASSNDYSLSNEEVTLNGIDDGEVEIRFNTARSGSFFGIETRWNTKEEGTSYITLTDYILNSNADSNNVHNNTVSDGIFVYDDSSLTGFDVDANGSLMAAKYKIDKDTPEGTYEIKLYVECVNGKFGGTEEDSEEFYLSSTVTVTRDGKKSIVPDIDGYQTNYEYSGDKIEPEITVKDIATQAVLQKNIDYTVTYGSNTNAGTGTITIHPVDSSVYEFTETSVNFTIDRVTIIEDNIICPESIMYTGMQLNPEVLVKVNNKTLVNNTDYTLTMNNLNGEAGEKIEVIVEGVGNYTGTATKEISITAKPTRNVNPINDVVMEYGDIKKYEELVPYEITFTSSDDEVIQVTHSFDGTTNENSIYANSVGNAIITVSYAETDEYAETTQTFNVTVNKHSIILESAVVEDKIYDGTKDAVVSSVKLIYPPQDRNWQFGSDYVAVAEFDSPNAGTRNANVEVTLLGDMAERFKFQNNENSIETIATITPQNIEGASVVASGDIMEYDGDEKKPDVVVTKNGNQLEKGVDYEVAYENNIDVSNNATIVITGINNYYGNANGTFSINPCTITSNNVSLEYTRVRYTGEYKEPATYVYINGHAMPSSEYTTSYNNNLEIGTAEAIITSQSNNFNTPTGGITKNFEIVGKDVLELSGISDNQSISYTGREVVLVGNLKVAENTNNVDADDVEVTWYDENGNPTNRPINVGRYSAQYNYSDVDYVGNLTINFEIVKAHSGYPTEINDTFETIIGNTLSSINLSIIGLVWQNPDTVIERGVRTYPALFTRNNDSNNYLTDTVHISVHGKEYIVPEISNIESEYEYTGGQIKPNAVVKIYGTQTVLTLGNDYTVEYGENINCGIGTITIKPKVTSDFIFTEVTNNFSIIPCVIKSDEVFVQNTINYQGHSLTPSVSVFKNGRLLVEGTDYSVSYSNQNGGIGSDIVVTITGKGNYQGVTVKNVRITEKGPRSVAPIEDTTLEYGMTKSYISVEDGEVSFSSSNPEILSITHDYSRLTSTNTIEAKAIGNVVVTVTYPETNDYAETIQTFEVEVTKRTLRITDVEIVEKIYDGTTDAIVNSISFDDKVNRENGIDYNAEAVFEDPNAGKNKDVLVTLSLTDNSSNTYQLESDSYNAVADILVASILNSNVSLEYTTVKNDGTAKEPKVIVETNGKEISPENYTVQYKDNDRAGTAKVTIRGIGNYSGEVTKDFEIVDKKVISISGIENNQRIEYTGREVVLDGEVTVSSNDEGVTADNLTEKWFDSNNQEIDRPIEVGKYKVEYSYSSEDSAGKLVVNFEITKADSGMPIESQRSFVEIERNKLNVIRFETEGLVWKDENEAILRGNNRYIAKYTKNNDAKNYTTKEVGILVYGKALVRVNTSVNGNGGRVSSIEDEVLEGEEVNVKFIPDEGYEIEKVTLNGKDVKITNNELTYIAGNENANIIVTYKRQGTKGSDNNNENNMNTNTSNTNSNNTNTNSNINSNINTNTNENTNTTNNTNTNNTQNTNGNTNTNTNNYSNSNVKNNNNVNTNTNSANNTNANSNAVSVASVGNVANNNAVSNKDTANSTKQQIDNEKTPSMGTNITIYIALTIMSVIGMISTFVYKRKDKSNIY
ncbi:MAG: hypothetical protein K6D97_01830 [Clostridia bacterium]|nr:hypothetical protein [Clostridia bacterium]